MKYGTVTLVGAGPGDPELLTVKAVKALQSATLLLVDDLVSAGIVALASPGARTVYVGKRGGCKSTPQAFIHKLMVCAAHAGETVVRLKGGDPFIFGRGGEEVEELTAAGIQVTVVNGITSGLAAATALGIPLTHREHAQGVVFVRRSMELWVGCVAGALEEEEFLSLLREVGFEHPSIEPTRIYTVDDAAAFLTNTGLDVETFARDIDGKFMGAFIRATKPGVAAKRTMPLAAVKRRRWSPSG